MLKSTFFFNGGSKIVKFYLNSLFAFLYLKARIHSNNIVMKTDSLASIRSAKGKWEVYRL
jgi:hypothetical protein